jgi:hypothetical protein
MNLLVFQEDKAYIKQCLENGEIDYVEAASETAKTEFFEYLNGRALLQQLAETYPLRRKKQEVPMWLYIASDISLRLHGSIAGGRSCFLHIKPLLSYKTTWQGLSG